MKNKLLIKSLFHAAQISEQIQKLTMRKDIVDAFGDEIQSNIVLLTNCTEKGNCLYNSNGYKLAVSGLINNSYYREIDYDYGPSDLLEHRYYRIKNGTFVYIDFCDSNLNANSTNFLKIIYRIAYLKSKINKILLRPQVAEEFEDMTYFDIEGFERNCIEQNSLLYDSDGRCIAEGCKWEPTGMVDNLYYVNQHTGYLGDDYSGNVYYKISDGLFVNVSFSC